MARRRALSAERETASPPPFQPVQLAKLVDHVPEGNRWVHELKFDGYRCIVSVGGGTRYDKTADSYLGFIHIVSIRLWMRHFVDAS